MREAATARRLPEREAIAEFVAAPADPATVREPWPPKRAERMPVGEAVTIRQLSKSFGARKVLSDIGLTIPAGQLLAIVGRSGCGKSTLLRLIAGLDRPTSGTITVGHSPVESLQPNVRLLFQDARLLPWQRVLGNVGIARSPNWRRDRRESAGRCRAWPTGPMTGLRCFPAVRGSVSPWPVPW